MDGPEHQGVVSPHFDPAVFSGAGRKPKYGDGVEFAVEGIDPRGALVGAVGAFLVRLERRPGVGAAAPGDRVVATVLRRRRGVVDARLERVLEAGGEGQVAPCPHAADCGGCSFQELTYSAQVRHKSHLATQLLAPVATALDGAGDSWREVCPAEDPFHYRNKMDFTFCARPWRRDAGAASDADPNPEFALGLFARGRHDKVLDLSTCLLAPRGTAELLSAARELALRHGLAPWDPIEHRGFLRHLVLRAPRVGGWLVHLVTSAADGPGFEAFRRDLLARVPRIETLVGSVSTSLATVATTENLTVWSGTGAVEEQLLSKRFRISAGSFFQVHTAQAERMFQRVREWLEQEPLARGGVLFDLYCGGGAIGITLSEVFAKVVGLELVPSAVEDARANARRNGVGHVFYECGDVPELLGRRRELGIPDPSVVVLDPPRAGLGPRTARLMGELAPPLLLLVSCNLRAAAVDLAALLAEGYRIQRAQLFDLFPQTPHLEGVFLLARDRGAGGA